MLEEPTQPPYYTPKTKRPLLITLMCVIGFIVIIASTYFLLLDASIRYTAIASHGYLRLIITIFFSLITLFALIKIWRMQRSGFWIFVITLCVNIIYNLTLGIGYYVGYTPAIIMVIVCLFYYKKMQ